MSEFPNTYFELQNNNNNAFNLALFTLKMSISEYNSLSIEDLKFRKNLNEYGECLALNILIEQKKSEFIKPKLQREPPINLDNFYPHPPEKDQIISSIRPVETGWMISSIRPDGFPDER
jgi:hypothetical protein